MFGLEEMFDFNHDGELGPFEQATQYMSISGELEDYETDYLDDEED